MEVHALGGEREKKEAGTDGLIPSSSTPVAPDDRKRSDLATYMSHQDAPTDGPNDYHPSHDDLSSPNDHKRVPNALIKRLAYDPPAQTGL